MGIENSSQPFLLLVPSPCYTGGGKNTSDLSKNTDGVNRIDIRDDVRVCLFVFEEERAQIRLAALHHFLYSCNDMGITDDHCLVETGKEWSSSDREGEDLWIVFGDRLTRDRS